MRRGELRIVDFEPATGAEVDQRRPAIVVSNDRANASVVRLNRGVVSVVPVTSNVTRVLDFQVLLPAARTGLRLECKARAEQVRSVSIDRVGRRLGRVPADLMIQVDAALLLHLAL